MLWRIGRLLRQQMIARKHRHRSPANGRTEPSSSFRLALGSRSAAALQPCHCGSDVGEEKLIALRSVYIVESLHSDQFFERTLDGHAANEVLKILQVPTEYRIAFTWPLLKRAVAEAAAGNYQVLHFSAHGDDDGPRLTNGKDLSWREFAQLIAPASGRDKALVMATCQGGHRRLTRALAKEGVVFGWVFGSTAAKGVTFSDSCLAWSILYNRLVDHGFHKTGLKTALAAINAAIDGDFIYRRWDGQRYRRFPAAD